ncbi:flippase [Natrinema versiforme]|uniref:Membrane protein involved in the export of O-antigen and teichoic acid n=1 Tax=Natrinema versiforme JCM 10478 TaxID=1227496 RepID=L9Y029_9EURY|nr:flippase [Natrinema versiforme]ELY67057.1 membrane protein involved in the export of O-antigen and teichoic acid [Natrinema versiforme JCM 10478]
MNLAKAALKLFSANVINAAISFLGIALFARALGASQIGSYFLFVALLGILTVPADFGLRGAVEKRISEGNTPDIVFTTALLLKTVPISLVVVVLIVARGYIAAYLGAGLVGLLIVALFLQEVSRMMISVLKGELRVGETAVLESAQKVCWLLVGGGLVLVGYQVRALVYGLIAGMIVLLVWGWYRSETTFDRPTKTYARNLLSYSKYNSISSIGSLFYSWMDVLVIGIFLTQVHVGAYEVAWRISVAVVLLSEATATAIFPQVSKWNAQNAAAKIERIIPDATTASLALVIPAFFGALLFSRDILRIVFGSEFEIAWLVLIILLLEKVFQAIHMVMGRSLQAIDRPDLAARATMVSIVANLGLNVSFVWAFGLTGAAVATLIAATLSSYLHVRYLERFLTIRVDQSEIGWCIVSALGMVAVLSVVTFYIPIETIPQLGGVITSGAIFYGLFLLLSPSIRSKLTRNMKAAFR